MKALLQIARQAREHAYCPYSKFPVGAALRAGSGKIYSGCNVESAAFGAGCCAERVALYQAVARGEREFTHLAVVADITGGPTPCGICRQALAEFGPLEIVTSDLAGNTKTYSLWELLPEAFLQFKPGEEKIEHR